MAGVSQSYIAKLEAKKIEPSYIKVKAIFFIILPPSLRYFIMIFLYCPAIPRPSLQP